MDFLQHTFMQRALIEAVLVGGICAIIGVYVVLNGLSFIGAGISHSTFAGVGIGLLLGIEPLFTALVFAVLVALSIGAVSEKSRLRHDTSVGIFFAATMALGVMLIGLMRDRYVDVLGYLFGNILALTAADVWMTLVMAAIVAVIIWALFKEFLALSFDAEVAAVMGLPVRRLHYLLLVLIALTVVMSVKSVGVVLVSALIVTPAAAAWQLTTNFRRMMLLSFTFGTASSLAGLLLSWYVDIPSGAGIVLTATLVFFLAWWLSPRRRQGGTPLPR